MGVCSGKNSSTEEDAVKNIKMVMPDLLLRRYVGRGQLVEGDKELERFQGLTGGLHI